jgi:hypothetical protein
MASFSFNVALGREVEFYNRVNDSDPTNAVFVGMVLAGSGLETDAVLKDFDTFAAIVAGTTNEVTNTNYARVSWSDVDLAPYTVDDTFDSITLQIPNKTFTTILTGDSWRKFVIGYDSDSTGGTDANIIPVKAYDMLGSTGTAIVPNGGNIICSWPDGFHIAA